MSAIRNIINLRSVDNQSRLSIGTFNGRAYLTIFKGDSNIPLSVWLSDTIRELIINYLSTLAENPQPNVNNSIFVSKYDETSQQWIKQAVIGIGTDEQGMIQLKVTVMQTINENVPQDMLNQTFTFPLTIPKSIDLENPLSDKDRNIMGTKIFCKLLSHKVIIAEMLSQETILNGNGNGNKISSNTNQSNVNNNFPQDIPF